MCRLFFKIFPLCFFGFVCWLHLISVSFLWRGVPMENKSPAAVSTKPSRFGTRSLEIASQRCVNWQSPHCESQILMVLSQLPLAICFPGEAGAYLCPVSVDLQTVHFTFQYFQHIFIGKGYVFEWPVSWTLPGTWFSCFFVVACWWKKPYPFECPVTGHSQKFILKSFALISFSSMYFSTKSYLSEWYISRHSKQKHDFFC